jgi:Leucine-rich repeat (LRR) protein
LFYFYVSSNYLSRAFSEALPKALTYFFAADCLFTGMVLLDGFSLRELSVESNLFSGLALRQIPPQLQYLSVADNRIPSWSPAIDTLLGHPFVFLDLSSNRLNASLPATVWNTSVQQLLLNSNGFSGTFPDRGDRVCSMRYLSVAGNGLWGSLPVDLQQCANLTTFFASDMQLTGSLWGRFATQRWLQVVVVSNNSLTGPLDDVFAASSASGLILNAAYNAFSGTLPVASLRTGLYKSLILTSNCLSGTLPGDALCANGNLTELILSGLHSAASCRYDVFPTLDKLGVYSSYVETSAVGGTVPSCVFDGLSQLTYLALSGNALTGALPGEVRLPETLQGLDLSHNQLTGTIAAGIVAANLTLLDLSFNRLSGTISAQASDVYVRNPAARVSLEVNELSGTLPRSWVEAVDISVLDGNLFACEVGHIGQTANRPLHDPRQATYACGSSTTNVALVVTLAVGVGVALVLLWVRWRGASAAWAVWRSVVDAWSGVVGPWRVDALALLVYLVGSLVVYAVLTATTTVYAETYVWSVSLALQRGGTAGVVALGWLGWLVWTSSGRHTRSAALLAAKTSSSSPSSSSVSYGRMATAVLMVGTVHVLPVLVVNLVYVYTTTLRLSGWVQAAVVLLMSVFKAAWNALVNVYMASDAHAMGHLLSSTHHGVLFVRQLLLWCGLINLIVSPVVTEALVSPDCFRYLFARIQTNSYSIAGGTCYWISYESATTGLAQAIPCLSYAALQQTYNNNVTTHSMIIISTTSNGEASTVDYQAGFAYNYQCSFSLLQAFVYVFVYKYVLSTAMLPWVWWRLKRWQTWAYVRGGLSSAWYRWTTLCLPPMMKLVDSVEVDRDDEDGQAMESNRVRLAHWAKVDQVKKCEMWLSLRLTGDLAVALSFGVLFPLLGLLALMGIGSEVLQTLWMVQRLRAHVDRVGRRAMSMAAGSGRSTDHRPALDDGAASGARMAQRQWTEYHRMAQEQLDALETVVPSSLQSMVKNLLTVQCFAAVTWALTLYDIVGRAEGSVTSLWILVVTLTMPWWMMVLWQATRSLWTSSSRELPAIDEGDKGAVQLMEVTAFVNLVAV